MVRFAPDGDLLVVGIAFNRSFDQADRPVDSLVCVARYKLTPGSPGGVSTLNSAANPPNFTYAGTTVVDRGAVGFAVPGATPTRGHVLRQGWAEVDLSPPSASDCARERLCRAHELPRLGSSPIMFSVSEDGGGRSRSRR